MNLVNVLYKRYVALYRMKNFCVGLCVCLLIWLYKSESVFGSETGGKQSKTKWAKVTSDSDGKNYYEKW